MRAIVCGCVGTVLGRSVHWTLKISCVDSLPLFAREDLIPWPCFDHLGAAGDIPGRAGTSRPMSVVDQQVGGGTKWLYNVLVSSLCSLFLSSLHVASERGKGNKYEPQGIELLGKSRLLSLVFANTHFTNFSFVSIHMVLDVRLRSIFPFLLLHVCLCMC